MKKRIFPIGVISAAYLFIAFGCSNAEEKKPKAETKVEKSEKKKKEKKAMKENNDIVIETKFGKIEVELLPDLAPKTVENFKKLASSKFYDKTTFHRVIPGFMIQGGDPNSKDDDRSNDGTGGPGYSIKAEFSKEKHKRGMLSMARSSDPDSAGSQFFIVVKESSFLDGKYTIFGKVKKGMDVADKIVAVPRDKRDNPLEKVEMTSVR